MREIVTLEEFISLLQKSNSLILITDIANGNIIHHAGCRFLS